jgi:hypothetical protein
MTYDTTWKGEAAKGFKEGFLIPFKEAAARQIRCGVYLANAILISFVLPSPLDDLAGGYAIVLDKVGGGSGAQPTEWEVLFSPWTPDMVTQTSALLATLEERIAQQDSDLRRAISNDSDTYFVASEFDLRGPTPNPPGSLDSDMVADIGGIYEIGARYLPSAADQFGSAAYDVSQIRLPAWFTSRMYPRAAAEFEYTLDGLVDGVRAAKGNLLEAGAKLVEICNLYADRDAATATLFEAIKEAVPPPDEAVYRAPPGLADAKDG